MAALGEWLVYLFLPWLYIHWQNQKLGEATEHIHHVTDYVMGADSRKLAEGRDMAILFASMIVSCDNDIFVPYEVMSFTSVMDNLDVMTIQEPDGIRLKVRYLT